MANNAQGTLKKEVANPTVASTDVKLPLAKQLVAAMGDFGYQFMYMWVASFITIYYTDVIGVEALVVSGLLLSVRLFDAVNDPIMGAIADRTNTRWGRFRPWVVIGGVMMSIVMVMLFNANPEWSDSTKIAWMYTFYILVTIAATICNMSYQAMIGVLTTDSQQRASITGKRMIFSNIAVGIIGMLAVKMIATLGGSNEEKGYFMSVLICCCIGMPVYISAAIFSKEVVTPVSKEKNIPVKAMLKTVAHSAPMLIMVGGFFLLGFSSYGRATMNTYYFKYYVGDYGLYATYSLFYMIGSISGALTISTFAKYVTNKGKSCGLALLAAAGVFVLIYFFPAPSPIYFALLLVFGILQGFISAVMISMVPDCSDYGEYTHGVRCDGFLSAIASFAMKAGGAVGPAVMLAVIDTMGFVPNEVQSDAVNNLINASVSLIPAVLYTLIAILFLGFYKIDLVKQREMVQELDRRRKENNT